MLAWPSKFCIPFIFYITTSLHYNISIFYISTFLHLNIVRDSTWTPAESVPLLPLWVTCVRESRATQRSPRVFLPPLQLPGTPTAHQNAGRSQFTRDGQRDSIDLYASSGTTDTHNKADVFSTRKPFLFHPRQPTIQLSYY